MLVCWPMTLEGERKLETLERKFLRIFRSKKNNVTQMYENRSNKNIYNNCEELNITARIWYKILSWLGHVLRSNTIAKEALNWRP